MTKNTSELLDGFHDGRTLTDAECIELLGSLTKIEESLVGTGLMFHPTRVYVIDQLNRVRDICDARGLNRDPGKTTCPHCFRAMTIDHCVMHNIQAYHSSKLISTSCCQQPVRISGSMRFSVTATTTDQDEDDWGAPFAK